MDDGIYLRRAATEKLKEIDGWIRKMNGDVG